ncbi:MAG: hypothetical protein C0617_08165 [Desulfuromonas sp.]|nr:MAG: hypothetical protein C0617_08165 [Desulfuromonas sp.]
MRDFKIASLALPVRGEGHLALDGVVKVTSPTRLEAMFLPGQIPFEALDQAGRCRISCEVGLSIFQAEAFIEEVLDDRRLSLVLAEVSSQGDTRRKFRVDSEVYLKFWRPGEQPPSESSLERVNLSGCGLRFSARQQVPPGEELELEIALPGATLKVLGCRGRVVDGSSSDDQPGEVALQITDISPDHLDKLTEFCLGEKFKQLGSRVKFLGSMLDPKHK